MTISRPMDNPIAEIDFPPLRDATASICADSIYDELKIPAKSPIGLSTLTVMFSRVLEI